MTDEEKVQRVTGKLLGETKIFRTYNPANLPHILVVRADGHRHTFEDSLAGLVKAEIWAKLVPGIVTVYDKDV